MKILRIAAFAYTALLCLFASQLHASGHRVLVVMSYEEDNPWCREIKEGIDSVLSETSDITYFYMDTKVNLEGGEEKAREAYSVFEKIRPDGVITADDNAQQMFVLPYLANKTEIPVMFCGVNADPDKYGYPSTHISGILERGHIRESIAFAKQLVPSIQNVVFIARDSPSGNALSQQIKEESQSFPTNEVDVHLINSIDDLAALEAGIKARYDAVYVDSLEGIKDTEGEGLSNRQAVDLITSMYQKPIIGANQYHLKQGALCAVVKTGQEQGKTAAEMLLKAMQGTPVSDLPVTKNYRGKRIINVTAMEQLGIKVRPIVLLGTTLTKTEE